MSLSDLITKLHSVFDTRPNGLSGRAEERANARLVQREDALYADIARYQVGTPQEFFQKLTVVLEANSLVALPNGKIGGASSPQARALVRSLMRDATRLFDGKSDDRLMALIDDRRQIVAEIEALNLVGERIIADANAKVKDRSGKAHREALEAGGIDEFERDMDALYDRKGENERRLARCKVRSFAAATAVAEILGLVSGEGAGEERLMAIVNDDCFRLIAANLAAFLSPARPVEADQKQAA